MRSLRHQMLILLLGSLIILAVSFILVFGWSMKEHAIDEAAVKAQSDLAICKEFIDTKYPGSWLVRDGELYKGTTKISLNNEMVDHLAQLTGDTVTIFLGDTRAATTVRGSNGERAIGTEVSENVAEIVLKNGQTYIGEADVVGQRYQTVYAPLRAENGLILGMLYVGISHDYQQDFIKKDLILITGIGLVIIILAGILFWLYLRRLDSFFLQEIMLETQDTATEHSIQQVSASSAAEIEKLEDALIQMAEHIQTLTGEISRSTNNSSLSAAKSDIHAIIEQIKDSEPICELSDDFTETAGSVSLAGLDTPWCSGAEGLPKGLNKATLDQITQFLQTNRRPISTEEVAEGVKLTRVTVRRYLEFLEQRGVLKSEQKCGTVGRPVKIFIPL